MERRTTKEGLTLLKEFEGCELKAYKCVKTEKYYTIGYGHYGADVKENMTITREQAEQLLIQDLKKFEKVVNKYMSRYNFNQHQFNALVCFAYNIGNIDGLTKNGSRTIKGISDAMLLYVNHKGKVLNGLVRRRKAEQKLFNKLTLAERIAKNGT